MKRLFPAGRPWIVQQNGVEPLHIAELVWNRKEVVENVIGRRRYLSSKIMTLVFVHRELQDVERDVE